MSLAHPQRNSNPFVRSVQLDGDAGGQSRPFVIGLALHGHGSDVVSRDFLRFEPLQERLPNGTIEERLPNGAIGYGDRALLLHHVRQQHNVGRLCFWFLGSPCLRYRGGFGFLRSRRLRCGL